MIKWVETYNKCIHYRKSVTVTVIKFSGEQLNYSISYLTDLNFRNWGDSAGTLAAVASYLTIAKLLRSCARVLVRE